VGDVFGSLFALATGVLIFRSGVLPRWLGWVSILVGILFFLQGFTLGGVIAKFRLALDGIGFVLLLIFVLVSSVILLRRENSVSDTARRNRVDNLRCPSRSSGSARRSFERVARASPRVMSSRISGPKLGLLAR
jgi:heme A synthase